MARLAVLLLMAACSGGDSATDAAVVSPDVQVDATTCATRMCGATCCPTAGHVCAPSGGACACPAALVREPFSTVIDQMDTMRQAPDVLGIGIVDGTDGKLHALVVGFHPTTTAVGTDIVLPVVPLGDVPFVGFGYDVNIASQTTRATYFSSQGTLRLTRRCAAGVAGTMASVTLREQTSIDDQTPHPQGCMLAVPDLAFDFGSSCP